MGMLLTPITRVFGSRFMELIPKAAAVPMTEAARAETKAISSVLYKASMMAASWNISKYQRRVNPPHWERDLEALKESPIIMRIGA